MKKNSPIYIAGHRGLVGSAIVRALHSQGYSNLILPDRGTLDLTHQASTHDFFKDNRIEYVFLAAAKVGGIQANSTQQADFLYQNLMIASNVIHAAATTNVEKLLFLGSSCIYPKFAPQPIQEDSLLSGFLEPTNEGYAIAKIAGLKLCEMYQRQYRKRFISAMPCNLYGPGDNFHPENSHVIPGMMRRFHEAKVSNKPIISIWGTGTPKREFLFVDDLADALLLLMEKYEDPITINVGAGQDLSISDLAREMADVVQFKGDLVFDTSKPDGTPRKIMDSSRSRSFGWAPKHNLKDGLRRTYQWAIENGKI